MDRGALKELAKRILPASVRRWMRITYVRVSERPPYKMVRWGSLRRVTPIHVGWSIGRGNYIDRYYIERYLEQNASNIRGRVLELAENEYTVRFGGDRVTQSDVLDVRQNHPLATIIADLTVGDNIPSNAFDCVDSDASAEFHLRCESRDSHDPSYFEAGRMRARFGCWYLAYGTG